MKWALSNICPFQGRVVTSLPAWGQPWLSPPTWKLCLSWPASSPQGSVLPEFFLEKLKVCFSPKFYCISFLMLRVKNKSRCSAQHPGGLVCPVSAPPQLLGLVPALQVLHKGLLPIICFMEPMCSLSSSSPQQELESWAVTEALSSSKRPLPSCHLALV